MAIYKCKMCGAPLNVNNGQTVATCEFCGSKQTVANADDERKENLFNRANSLRMNCEFDKAILSYQSILATFPKEPEAHWGLCLCRYGIEYVDDLKTHSKKPTIHRMSYESILNDSDYLAALENADVIAKEEYQTEAKEIADIQKNILSISQKEDPFDVFICYKETDENGKRTRDSVMAQEIYNQLMNKGYKVFFARITLENKLGTMYEPYIFAALNSAKIMLVLGTKKEYFEAVWVKNEWQRFIDMMQTRPDRYLIPCYKDMDAYEMPEQFLSFQGQDMTKLGFMQDLVRGIDKIMGRNEKPKDAPQAGATVIQNGFNASSRLKRAEILIGDQDYQKASSLLEDVLNNDPTNSMAYLFYTLIDLELTSVDDLKDIEAVEYYEELPNYKKAYKFANKEEKQRLDDIKEYIERRNEEDYLSGLYKNAIDLKDAGKYEEAYKSFNGIVAYKPYKDSSEQAIECLNIINDGIYKNGLELKENKQYDEAVEIFNKIADFKDSKNQISECKELKNAGIYNEATTLKNDGKFDEASAIFEEIHDYSDSTFQIEECKRLKEEARKEAIYSECFIKGKIRTNSDGRRSLQYSCQHLPEISGYKDSDQLLERYQSILKEYDVKKKRRIKVTALISAATAAVFTGVMTLTCLYIVPQTRQSSIEVCIDQGKYQEARTLLEQNRDFGDTSNLKKMCWAGEFFERKMYEEAISWINDVEGGAVTVSYDSNGGNVSKSQETIKQASFINNDPNKDGYTFYGWEQTAYTINSKSHSATLSLLASYSPISYSIKFDLNGGGTSESLPTEYTVEDSFTLPNPTRKGYTFDGWYLNGDFAGERITSIVKGTTGNMTLRAKWSLTEYSIIYKLNGGKNNENNPSTYTAEDEVILEDAVTKDGYSFAGWYLNGDRIESIARGTTGNIVLEARWFADLQTLDVSSSDETKGTAEIVSGQGYTDEEITVKATPTEGCIFKGWYENGKQVSMNKTYIFSMPARGVSLTAEFWTEEEEKAAALALGITPTFNAESNTVTYGLYPQTHVSDEDLISSLNELTDAESNGWYLYDGSYYAKKAANPLSSSYEFDDGATIVEGTEYWFRCEPIEWKILSSSDGTHSLVSSKLLDAHCYHSSTSSRTIDGKTIYANNYEHSDIRSWLNGDFYDSAFALDDSLIQTVTVDNSAETTNSATNEYACNDTQDKVYLLSYRDYTNVEYFADDASRECKPTDWAKANGAYYYSSSGTGFYWTRSPYSGSSFYVSCVDIDGDLQGSSIGNYSLGCVRPSLQIKVA